MCRDCESKYCSSCVMKHNGHNMFDLKEECHKLITPWIALKNQCTKYKNLLNDGKEHGIPEEILEVNRQVWKTLEEPAYIEYWRIVEFSIRCWKV